MYPKTIEQISDQVITITWDDDSKQIFFADTTRKACPCATCKDEKDEAGNNKNPFKVLKMTPQNIYFTKWEMVGRYAIRFVFSDRHDSGIYTYDYLREIGEKAE
ncbi:MAG: DUF971 domain-containing protein [Calditrichaeota bacterium]|nr:MAG: DUF971 domain-containing protein [Calditrichota bacterium]